MSAETELWQYFREVLAAVEAGNQGKAKHPYQQGTFMVSALAGEVEFTVKDISEEDAILIAADLQDMGIRAEMHASLICPACLQRVPKQDYCVQCRAKLPNAARPND